MTKGASDLPPAGWYEDPADSTGERRWTGAEWTHDVRPKRGANAAVAAPASSTDAPASGISTAEGVSVSGLKPRVVKALGQNIAPDERVEVVIVGASGQVIVGTQTRAFVIKPGFLAGATFGAEITSWSYTHIAGVQVHKGMMTGSVVIQGPGQTGQAGGYWRQGDTDPHKAQNAIPIAGGWETVNAGVARLRHLIAEAHAPSPAPAAAGEGTISIADELVKLASLRDSGVLSDDEFELAKGRLLGR